MVRFHIAGTGNIAYNVARWALRTHKESFQLNNPPVSLSVADLRGLGPVSVAAK